MAVSKAEPISKKTISIQDWSVISADIVTGNSIIQNGENMQMINMAAYHYAQAIEKSLKSLIKANSEKHKSLATHDICFLLVETELCCNGFIAKYPFIADNAQELSNMNGARYGNKCIKKGDAFVLMREAQDLFETLENELMERTGKNKDTLCKQANLYYQKEENLFMIDDAKSKYASKKVKGQNKKVVELNEER